MPETQFTTYMSLIGGMLIGAAAVLLMATTGRIAGVSGFVSRLLPPYVDDQLTARVAFVAGLIAAPILYSAIGGATAAHSVTDDGSVLVVGGLLVGFGSVIGGGCTSGHGICGLARFSRRSIAATATFFITAIATVFVSRHVIGG